jgi:hypothetical protein
MLASSANHDEKPLKSHSGARSLVATVGARGLTSHEASLTLLTGSELIPWLAFLNLCIANLFRMKAMPKPRSVQCLPDSVTGNSIRWNGDLGQMSCTSRRRAPCRAWPVSEQRVLPARMQ